MKQLDHCPVCSRPVEITPNSFNGTYHVDCLTCGEYRISQECEEDMKPEHKRNLARHMYTTRGDAGRMLTSTRIPPADEWTRVVDLASAERMFQDDLSPLEKYQSAISALTKQNRPFGYWFNNIEDRWAVPTMNDDEADSILWALAAEGHLSSGEGIGVTRDGRFQFHLTPKALEYVAFLPQVARRKGITVFVACRFCDELRPATEAICNTLTSMGYAAKILMVPESNDLVDIEIYEGIRESRFVVADLTYNRQSVYYEAGFAHGLGLDVILTCRSDHFDDKSDESTYVHFDLNHRPIIVYGDVAELEKELRGHIMRCSGSIAT